MRELFLLEDIVSMDFELIEENTIDVDIDNITEISGYSDDGVELYEKEDIHINKEKINELVQAVKQLNKEIQELKEKMENE